MTTLQQTPRESTCSNCFFSRPVPGDLTKRICMAHPPEPVRFPDDRMGVPDIKFLWPHMRGDGWCGEHPLNVLALEQYIEAHRAEADKALDS